MPDLTGEIIDERYHLERLIATGGMASIYEALDMRLDRQVAVKIMHPHLANDEAFVSRFIKEAKATAALSHPNVVSIQDQGWNEGGIPAVFIVMEYIDGFTLRDILARKGSLSPKETLQYLTPVVSAISEAHKIGIIHRDIKPENILVSLDGRVKIADFGLARGEQLGATIAVETSIVLGSVSYLSPEQVQRGVSDSRSDIYSLGVVFFELLTGHKPYEGETPIEIALKHVNQRIPLPSTFRSDIPAKLDSLIEKATAPNPDHRYKDGGELLKDLQSVNADIDPMKNQLSLALDIPVIREESKQRKIRGEVRIRNHIVEKKRTLTPANSSLETSSRGMNSTTEIRRRTSSRVRRNRFIALFIVIIVAASSWYQFAGPGGKISIPSLVGISETGAIAALAPLGIKATITSQDFSEEIPAGLVISSNPGGGGRVAKGETVYLTLSKGKERIKIPKLSGLTVEAATVALINAGLKIGSTNQSFNTNFAIGLVINGNPTTGSKVRRNSLVDLSISKGVQQITSRSYVGLSSDQALNELTALGFKVLNTFAYSDSVPAGAVISQSPDTTTSQDMGSSIRLIISQGSEFVFIPNVYALTQHDATVALENSQLQVIVRKIGTKIVKKVTNISPNAGTKVKRNSPVVITLG